MTHSLVFYPDPILTTVSKPVEKFDQELYELADDMIKIMTTNNGVGLAAIQVGIQLRMMVMETADQIFVICNPEIINSSNPKNGNEGCLSFPGVVSEVVREQQTYIKYQNLEGTWKEHIFQDLYARCVLHEIDHMNGELFINKVPEHKRFYLKGILKTLGDKYEQTKKS